VRVKNLFNFFIIKNLKFFLFKFRKNKFFNKYLFFFKFFKLGFFFEKNNINYNIILKYLKKKKIFFNFFFPINKKLKNKWKKFKKLKIPLFFFNNYKKNKFIPLIQFYNHIFKLKIKHIEAFILY
jgi:hypothetical protein